MEKQQLTAPIWKQLIRGEKELNLTYLPAKILLARWQTKVKIEGSAADIDLGANELFNIYFTNQALPNAKKDIETILK